jgi:hypothetical protein
MNYNRSRSGRRGVNGVGYTHQENHVVFLGFGQGFAAHFGIPECEDDD